MQHFFHAVKSLKIQQAHKPRSQKNVEIELIKRQKLVLIFDLVSNKNYAVNFLL